MTTNRVILVSLIIFGVIFFVSSNKRGGAQPRKDVPGSTTSKSVRGEQSCTYTITTETWTEIRVGYGKRITNLRIQSQNGRVYDWYIVINKDFKNPRKMPSGEDLGNNVQTIDCLLGRDQGIDTALVDYSEK
jgi:hypothetical protein